MIAIVDYGVGNLFSLESSFKAIGVDVIVTSDKEVIKKANKKHSIEVDKVFL